DHIQLDRLRRLVMQVMDEKFGGVDAIIGPALAGAMVGISNFTRPPRPILPTRFRQSETPGALSLPQGPPHEGRPAHGPTHTVPHGLCLYGKLFDEGTICEIGRALEGALGVSGRRPALA